MRNNLPPLIRTTLEERRDYHQRFLHTFNVSTAALLLVLVFMIWTLWNEEANVWFFVGVVWFSLLGIFGYLIFYHRTRRRVLDRCLNHGGFSVVNGTLNGIQRLGWKRVRYTIDGCPIDGTLVFPGYTAFFNTSVVDVIATSGQPVNLYLLPGGLIAGVVYPKLDNGTLRKPVTSADWQVIAQRQRERVKGFGISSLCFSLLLVGIAWFIEWQVGSGWESLGCMLVLCNGINLLLLGVQVAVHGHELRALMNRHDVSVYVQVFHGIAAEWCLTGTRYNGKTYGPQEFDGWIRLSGGLHRIQDDLTPADRGFLDPLRASVQVEYLVYRGRLIFLRSATRSRRRIQ